MLNILWTLCKLGLLLTIGLPFILIGLMLIVNIGTGFLLVTLSILEDIYLSIKKRN